MHAFRLLFGLTSFPAITTHKPLKKFKIYTYFFFLYVKCLHEIMLLPIKYDRDNGGSHQSPPLIFPEINRSVIHELESNPPVFL